MRWRRSERLKIRILSKERIVQNVGNDDNFPQSIHHKNEICAALKRIVEHDNKIIFLHAE
jgi:hypothetical protein